MHATPPYLPYPARRRSRTSRRDASRREQLSNTLAVLALLACGVVWAPDGTVVTNSALERSAYASQRAASAADQAPHPAG